MLKNKNQGFTFIELLLVILILGVLASLIIVNLRPGQRLAASRNQQRQADVASILNAIKQYGFDNNGTLPSTIQTDSNCLVPATFAEICKTGTVQLTCLGANTIPLLDLTNNSKYLVSIPIDPSSTSTYGTGYNVVKDANSRVTVCAKLAENGVTISLTR